MRPCYYLIKFVTLENVGEICLSLVEQNFYFYKLYSIISLIIIY